MDNQKTDIMNQPLNPDYQEGAKELAAMLTKIPEHIRLYLVNNFIKNIAKM